MSNREAKRVLRQHARRDRAVRRYIRLPDPRPRLYVRQRAVLQRQRLRAHACHRPRRCGGGTGYAYPVLWLSRFLALG